MAHEDDQCADGAASPFDELLGARRGRELSSDELSAERELRVRARRLDALALPLTGEQRKALASDERRGVLEVPGAITVMSGMRREYDGTLRARASRITWEQCLHLEASEDRAVLSASARLPAVNVASFPFAPQGAGERIALRRVALHWPADWLVDALAGVLEDGRQVTLNGSWAEHYTPHKRTRGRFVLRGTEAPGRYLAEVQGDGQETVGVELTEGQLKALSGWALSEYERRLWVGQPGLSLLKGSD